MHEKDNSLKNESLNSSDPQKTWSKFSDSSEAVHDPFAFRKLIVLLAAAPAGLVAYIGNNSCLGLATYFLLVTLFDCVVHFLLKIKPSTGADPEKLLASEHVTAEQFDAYFETRVWIRCASLGVAFVVGGSALCFVPSYSLKIFCGAYILSTLTGSLWVWLFLEIPIPRMFYRDDRYYVPGSKPPVSINSGQWALNMSNGRPPYGPVDL